VRLSKTGITGCVGGFTEDAKLDGVGPLVQTLAGKCRASRCNPGLYVAIDSDSTTQQLVEIASATRRAGFARVMVSTGDVTCTAAVKPETKKHPTPEIELE
jgi:hypothetical protein